MPVSHQEMERVGPPWDSETRQAMIPSDSDIASKISAKALAFLDSDEEPLAREIPLLSATSILLCVILIVTDVGRTCLSYSMKHFNEDVYPVDFTIIVTVTELFKATVVISCHLYYDGDNPFKMINPKILVPCALYVFTNNLFYAALHYVSPAIWIVLSQMRVVFLLMIYRFYLKQNITAAQYIGALILIVGVALAQMDLEADFRTIIGPALGIGAVASILSATAGVFTELVLKKGGSASIWRNQSHLYCGSAVISILPILLSQYFFENKAFDIRRASEALIALVILTVILTVLNGICVSLVIKNLDNIVRFQISAVTYIITAGLNKLLFPEKFHLSLWYVFSILVILFAVFLIERKKFGFCQRNPRCAV